MFIFTINIAVAQEQTIPAQPFHNHTKKSLINFDNLKERTYLGGTIGAWFGTTTYLNISPIVGIKISEPLSVGIGFTYNYYSQTYLNKKYVTTIYGGNMYARYYVSENIFAQVGLDRLNVPDYNTGILNDRAWVNNVLLGAGYREMFSDNGSIIAMIFYNINQTPLSPYQNPIIQVGFNFGF